MATCPSVKAEYSELIDTITLRNSDGINIPKKVREVAFDLAVDIIVVSIPRDRSRNYTSTPSEAFYGNATLVMQDCLELKIPVKFPRQRLYYGRVSEAFVMWQELISYEFMRAYFYAVGESLASLGTALGAGVIPPLFCCSFPDIAWQELPLREVYFNCPRGTQYQIEVTYTCATPFTDACGEERSPKSKRTDGDKDSGLPASGVFPNVAADPSNPFQGLKPATSNSDQGDYSNSKGESSTLNPSPLENPDPNNVAVDRPATSSVEGYYMRIPLIGLDGVTNGSTVAFTDFVACNSDSQVNVTLNGSPTTIAFTCGSRSIQNRTITVTGTSYSVVLNYLSGWSTAGVLQYGLLPSRILGASVPNGICI